VKFPKDWNLYVITDTELSGGRPHSEIARHAYLGGADVVQLRDKKMAPGEIYKESLLISGLSKELRGCFVVNDRIDIAVSSGADGVHVGWDDFEYTVARRILPPGFLLGCSVGNLAELELAIEAKADYIGVGPVFEARGTKPDAGPPVGLGFIEEVRSRTEIPIVAIGGIDADNAPLVIEAGADCVAVVSAVVGRDDIQEAARRIRDAVVETKERLSR